MTSPFRLQTILLATLSVGALGLQCLTQAHSARLGTIAGLLSDRKPTGIVDLAIVPKRAETDTFQEPTPKAKRAAAQEAFAAAAQLRQKGGIESLRKAIEEYEKAVTLYGSLRDHHQESVALLNIAFVYSALGEGQTALEFCNRALQVERATGNQRGEARTLNNIALLYSDLGEKQKALDFYNQALRLVSGLRDRTGEATTLSNIGSVYEDLGEHQKALEFYNQALALYRKAGDRKNEAITLNGIGETYEELGERQKALGFYTRALAIYQAVDDRLGEADTLSNIGEVYANMGQARKALEAHNQALALWSMLDYRARAAATLYEIGHISEDLGDKQKALESYDKALLLQNALEDKAGAARTLNTVGFLYYGLGQFQKALLYYDQALPLRRAAADNAGEARTLNNMGLAFFDLGEKEKALDYFKQALSIKLALGDESGVALTLGDIAIAYFDLGSVSYRSGEKQKALELFNQALKIRRVLGDKSDEAKALDNVARTYADLGEKEKALQFYSEVLPLKHALGDKHGEGRTLYDIGRAYFDLGQNRKALEFYQRMLSLKRDLGDKDGEATALNDIGSLYHELDENQEALEFYNQALQLEQALGNNRGAAITLHNIGTVYDALGETQTALDFYNRALQLKHELGDTNGEATTLSHLGNIYRELGKNEDALKFFNQALELWRKVGNKVGEATVLGAIGGVYDDLDEKQKALGFYNQSLLLEQSSGDKRSEAGVQRGMGLVYFSMGDMQQALAFNNRALSLARELEDKGAEVVTLHNIGTIYSFLGEKRKALELYNQAILLERAIGEKRGEGFTLNKIARVYWDLGEKQKAREFYIQALALEHGVGDKHGESIALTDLMVLEMETKRLSLAIFYGKMAVNVYQQLRANIRGLDKEVQQTFLRGRQHFYEALAEILLLQGRLQEAQQVLNLYKDQQYFDFTHETYKQPLAVAFTPREAFFAERYDEASTRADVVGQQLRVLRRQTAKRSPNAEESTQLQLLERESKSASDEFVAVLSKAETEFSQPATDKDKIGEIADTRDMQMALRELARQTGKKAVAVYTLVGTDYRALLITPDSITMASAPTKRNELSHKALQLWSLLQSDRYDPTKLAQELYAIIFKPLEGQLPRGTNTILWSLDGNLRYLPMGALHDGKQYLVERFNHVVFTRPDSERLLRAVSPQWTGLGFGSSQARTIDLFGDKINFNALPGVTDELRAVFRQRGAPGGVIEGEVLPDAKFTKATMLLLLKQRRPLVHISSHFSFRPGDEARSFLLLGDGGVMTLAEMKQQKNMFSGAELLTLSACNTAAQQAGADGREIDGFAELAQRLGADAVMATLWPVADNSTPWLMREFYQTRQTGITKIEALRRAQLALLRGQTQTKPLAKAQKGSAPAVEIVSEAGRSKRDIRSSKAVQVAKQNAPLYRRNNRRPFAHPYYWAPFILIGNWK